METARFEAIDLPNGKYGVIDTTNGARVGFSYATPPLYRDEDWGNWYAARGFADRLSYKARKASK